ncbi:hypothetical protein [Microbacterium sp. No. 7]|uniref:hypothetical protein n=1 Tax=Microbacterium sp. No. 7 TaxID=1714373 RepID=UPI0006D110E8|nr:hypothetical protein [Microbacterium sp. No. 7]ALJ22139.1 potassium transporter Trk [Microbacterium sp. No. 7]
MSDTPPQHTIETARVRRAPRFSVFFLLGAALGVLTALILTFAFDGSDERSPFTTVAYSTGQVFGFLLLFCVPIGLILGGVVAVVLDRTVGRRTREVTISRDRIIEPD